MKKYIWHVIILLVAAVFAVFASIDFLAMHHDEPIADNPNLTEIRWLSDYSEGLAGTDLDTPIYVFDSGVPGGTFLSLEALIQTKAQDLLQPLLSLRT